MILLGEILILVAVGLIVALIVNKATNEVPIKTGAEIELQKRIDELYNFSEKISKTFNQNTESYNSTKGVIIKELEGIKGWTDDAVKLINDNCDDIKELQESVIVIKNMLSGIEKDVSRLSNRKFRGKRVITSNKY